MKSSKSAPTNPPQYSIELDNILIRLQNSGIDLGLSGSPGDNDPVYSLKDARTELNQLTYTQVLELIPSDKSLDDLDPKEKINRVEYAKWCIGYNQCIYDITKALKAKYIGGDSDE